MKYISVAPSRLYCNSCEEVYNLPQGGSIKLYQGHACPLDGFELVICQLSGRDGKTFPLCPLCYNQPPFEDVVKVSVICQFW